jgi:hypothetical protein
MRSDQFIGGDFTWFTAVVEDINDTDNLNRVKVRCHGWHTDDTTILKTSHLPWATVIMPVTSASIQGNGGNHHLEVGSWVVGFFRDGPSAQDPIIMGSIATQTNGTQDIPTESSVDNKVYKSKAGHLIEIDNTSDDETLSVTHAKGAKITIDKDNNLSITNSGTTKIESDGIITIKSDIKTTII